MNEQTKIKPLHSKARRKRLRTRGLLPEAPVHHLFRDGSMLINLPDGIILVEAKVRYRSVKEQ